jgi:hypothetical protein
MMPSDAIAEAFDQETGEHKGWLMAHPSAINWVAEGIDPYGVPDPVLYVRVPRHLFKAGDLVAVVGVLKEEQL